MTREARSGSHLSIKPFVCDCSFSLFAGLIGGFNFCRVISFLRKFTGSVFNITQVFAQCIEP